jgi:large subunit ribosomal protein L1
MDKEDVLQALAELRKHEKKKFSQSADLIINLKSFDIKRENVSLFVTLPFRPREIKVAAFLNTKSKVMETITKPEFDKYKDKKAIKNLVKNYDFFIAHASLMPSIAQAFGKYLGTAGKMPSPQLGIIVNENEAEIKKTIEKAEKTVRVRTKEPCIKLVVGKEEMKDEEIAENIITIYNAVLNVLPRKKDNIRNVLIKFTMSKPAKIKIR